MIKAVGGKFVVDVNKRKIPRIRRVFTDKAAAFAFECSYLERYCMPLEQGVSFGDARLVSDLVFEWFRARGVRRLCWLWLRLSVIRLPLLCVLRFLLIIALSA